MECSARKDLYTGTFDFLPSNSEAWPERNIRDALSVFPVCGDCCATPVLGGVLYGAKPAGFHTLLDSVLCVIEQGCDY